MKYIKIVAITLLLLALVTFSVQNSNPAAITFFWWTTEVSQALLLFLSFCLGALFSLTFLSIRATKRKVKNRKDPESVQPAINLEDKD